MGLGRLRLGLQALTVRMGPFKTATLLASDIYGFHFDGPSASALPEGRLTHGQFPVIVT